MEIGISSSSLYPLETEKSLEFLCQNEIPVTEIFFNSVEETGVPFVKQLAALSKTYGTRIHSVHPCGSVGEPYFLFSGYERRFKETFEFYKRYYEAAAILGAKLVVLHGDSEKCHISDEEYAARLLRMNEEAAKWGVMVSHENVCRYRMANPENIKKLRERTNDKIKFTYDVKQCIRAIGDTESVYDAMQGNIVNVHISDHNSQSDCMLPGRGEYDFASLFEKLEADNYDGPCLIEVYSNAYKDYQELIDSYNFVNNIHKKH